jgi:flagellar motor switch/type III secretory pathway protein FliN
MADTTPDDAAPADSAPDAAPQKDAERAARLLAAAPVEIVAEIGRVTLRGDELLGMLRGSVVSIGPRRPDLVTLRVGGRAWARGELCNLDGALGVRLTELLAE